MADERKKDSGLEILGAAIFLLLLALLCHFHVICPLPECPEGQVVCSNCPGSCCLPDGSCPCPAGSAPCGLYCPDTINCPSGCCNMDTCVCAATPSCPPHTVWSDSRGCCIYVDGLFIGDCAILCSTDPLRIGGCVRGLDACDSGGCCPFGSIGWDSEQSCCVDEEGECIGSCVIDSSLSACPIPFVGGCDSTGCCPEDTYWSGVSECCVYSDSNICYGSCGPLLEYNSILRCCVNPEVPDVCAEDCPDGTVFNSELDCCVYEGTEVCSENCPPPYAYSSVLRCCVDPADPLVCIGDIVIYCPPDALNFDPEQECCIDENEACISDTSYTCESNPLGQRGCPANVGSCPSSGCCPEGAIGWDPIEECCIDMEGDCILSACSNPITCSSDNLCCPGYGCVANECKPCSDSTCTNTELCDCPLGCDCAGSSQACISCANPFTCSINSDCCCNYECTSGQCRPTSSTGQCVNPSYCDANRLCCSGYGCVANECKPCNQFTCTDTGLCDCPLGCDCAGSNQACVSCVNPSLCLSDSDCCCNYGCESGRCVYSGSGSSDLVDCAYSGTVGACEEEIICSDGCVNEIRCIDLRLPEGQCVGIAGSCNTSSDCCCGYSCQNIDGNGVCCPGGLWTCYTGAE